jgi:pantoate--beta-alanine ligase
MTMKVIDSISGMVEFSRQLHLQQQRIGLVPTMGYLHEGHLSLMRLPSKKRDRVVVSIFVNPSQFAPGEDFEKYPRDFKRDQSLCQQEGVDCIFHPAASELYSSAHRTYVITDQLSARLCGLSRPIHFQGVTTIVAKLFNIIQPDVAVFGQKDAQQSLIIRQMVSDLNIPVQILVAPVVRETDGLALSSRNKYLSPAQRAAAPVLYQALQEASRLIQAGETSSIKIRETMMAMIKAEPQVRLDYLAIVDFQHLEPVQKIAAGTLIAVAAFFGTTRLIDNIIVA